MFPALAKCDHAASLPGVRFSPLEWRGVLIGLAFHPHVFAREIDQNTPARRVGHAEVRLFKQRAAAVMDRDLDNAAGPELTPLCPRQGKIGIDIGEPGYFGIALADTA